MFKANSIVIAMIFFICSPLLKAQLPSNDNAWVLQSSLSDEFNTTPNFTTQWNRQWPWGAINFGADLALPQNVVQSGTTLKIKADTLIPPVHSSVYWPEHAQAVPMSAGVTFVYQGGALQSKKDLNTNKDFYKFGYFEISARYPTSYWPLFPAFWLWSSNCNVPYYDEIDIAENGGEDAFNGHRIGAYTHLYTSGNCTTGLSWDGHGKSYPDFPKLSDDFYKYAVEWSPDKIVWYFEDVPFRTVYDPTGVTIPQHEMAVILNFSIDALRCYLPSDWNNTGTYPRYPSHGDKLPTHFLQNPSALDFEIDYFHYYKLNTGKCNDPLVICNPSSDYSDRDVRKSITTGGVCSVDFDGSNTAGSYTLRATDYILLDEGTTCDPTGTGYFAIKTMACPE